MKTLTLYKVIDQACKTHLKTCNLYTRVLQTVVKTKIIINEYNVISQYGKQLQPDLEGQIVKLATGMYFVHQRRFP